MELWKDIWFYVFFIASGLFYLIVIAVAIKSLNDVKGMIKGMLTERHTNTTYRTRTKAE